MNKEIKFRSWAKEKQELIYDFGIVYNSTFQENEKRILMQHTGLKDKNGKEIYEGDIIKYKLWEVGSYAIREVIFEKGQFRTKHERQDVLGDPLWDCIVFEAEVIGNICENAELLNSRFVKEVKM